MSWRLRSGSSIISLSFKLIFFRRWTLKYLTFPVYHVCPSYSTLIPPRASCQQYQSIGSQSTLQSLSSLPQTPPSDSTVNMKFPGETWRENEDYKVQSVEYTQHGAAFSMCSQGHSHKSQGPWVHEKRMKKPRSMSGFFLTFFFIFLIGKLLYNFCIGSTVQQCEWVVSTYISSGLLCLVTLNELEANSSCCWCNVHPRGQKSLPDWDLTMHD